MIKPVLQDEAFLEDVWANSTHCTSGTQLTLWWIGQSGFLLHWIDSYLLFDPYLSDSLTEKYRDTEKPHIRMSERVVRPQDLGFVNVVTSTHNHTDHLDAQTLRPLRAATNDLTLIAPIANLDTVRERFGDADERARIVGLSAGDAVFADPFRVTGIAAAHPAREIDAHGNDRFLGFHVYVGPWSIYHSGDGVVYDGLVDALKPHDVDLAILPINGKVGNMNGADAARLAHDIDAKLVVPCHYEMFEFNTASPYGLFVPECERLGQRYKVLRAGERLTLTK